MIFYAKKEKNSLRARKIPACRLKLYLNPMCQNAALVVDDIAGTCHGAGTAGETLVGVDKGAVFRDLDCSGGADLLAQTAADAADLTDILAVGILVGAEDDDGIVLNTQMNDTLRAGKIAGSAADTLAFVDLGNAVGIQADRAELAGVDAGAAAGAAVGTKLIALGRLL